MTLSTVNTFLEVLKKTKSGNDEHVLGAIEP